MRIQRVGDEIGPDALEHVRPGMALGEQGRVGWFDGDDAHRRDDPFQIMADAAQGASRTDAGEEYIDLAVCVLKDFRARRFFMDPGIDGVGKLAGDEGMRDFPGQFLCLFDGAGHALITFSQDDFRSVGRHEVPPFDTHRIGHDENGPVSLGGSGSSQADSRIATGRFDED